HFFDEDVPKKIFSNPLFDEEFISMKIDPHHFNVESDLIESLLNRDSSIISSSSKIDSLFDEFVDELTLFKLIPPGINETDCDPEEETHFIKRLLYDNSSPHPPEEFSPVIHQPPQEMSIQEMEDLKHQYLDEMKRLSNSEYRDEIKIAELTENFNGMSIEIRKKEKLLQLEQWANLRTHLSKCLNSFCYDDDDEEDYTPAVTPSLSIEEPDNSLSMGDEHLDTILATESDEFIKSSVENLIPIPSESEGIPDHMCDVPFHDNSPPLDVSKDQFEDSPILTRNFLRLMMIHSLLTKSTMLRHHLSIMSSSAQSSLNLLLEETDNFDNSLPEFTTFSNILFNAEYESDSSDDQLCSDEDVPEKIFSTPSFDEEIIPMKMDQHYYNAEFDLMKSLRTHNSSLPISSKIDYLLDEFAGELTLLKSIPPGINEPDCDFQEDIRLIEKLLYDNSSPRPPEEFVSANSDAEIECFSPSPILVEDSDSLIEEIDLSCTPDYPMPPGIEDDDYDSERDILILKDLPSNDTLSIPEIESFYFDIPSFSRPPAKPPDGEISLSFISSGPQSFSAFCYMPDDDSWKEQSYLGCSSVSFLSPLISLSMEEFGPAQ
nr:hypothetical protein [Tanacetum cinerariifolium]